MTFPQPNILWICTDQQRWDTLGCTGNAFVRTPNLDRLAAGGALFENCFAQSPVCTPSRACFLTGRYPRTTRCRQNGQDISADETLITKRFAEAGWSCGLSGKLHLSACHPSVCSDMERRIDDGYEVFHWSHDTGDHWPTNAYLNWLREKGVARNIAPHPETREVQYGPAEENHQTKWCVDRAIDFIQERATDERPWLFSVNIFDPHHAFDPPESYLRRYEEMLEMIPPPVFEEGELAGKTPVQRIDHEGAYGGQGFHAFAKMTDREHRLVRAAYWAMCDLIDAQVGRLLEVLERTNQREKTIVVFTSDHGEMLGDHGIYLKGPYFYDPAVRVPLIISWPGRIVPMRSQALVELCDLPQTLLDAADLPHHPGMQGRTLWPILSGASSPERHREDVYCEYYNAMPWHREPTAQATMVRDAQWKIVIDHAHETGELYDLHEDPHEHVNLWDDSDAIDAKCRMLEKAAHRMAWTVDPLPERRAAW